MKIRSGFVSNSSSSSFLIIGNEIGDIFDEPNKDLNFKKDYYIYLGKDLWEDGIDLIDLNQEIYDWLYDHKWNIKDLGNGTIIKVIKLEENDKMNIPNDIKDANVWAIKVSHHSSESINDVKERYV